MSTTTEQTQSAEYLVNAKTSYKRHHRKEGKCFLETYQVIDLDAEPWSNGGLNAVVDLRLYGTGNMNFACLWVNYSPKSDSINGSSESCANCGVESHAPHKKECAGGNHKLVSEIHTQGSGSAGGYGYHRPSAAAHEAIHNAGFRLSQAIDGRGDSAITDALCAIARCLGIVRFGIVRSHA